MWTKAVFSPKSLIFLNIASVAARYSSTVLPAALGWS